MKIERSVWNLECPCTNDSLTLSNEADVKLGKMKVSKQEFGTFYCSEEGPVFGEIYFKASSKRGIMLTRAPLKVFLEITGRCNLNCPGCYLEKRNREVDFSKVKKLVDELSALGTRGIQLLGGEPTLFRKLPELCDYIKTRGMKVEIVSNGLCISDELIDKLKGKIDLFGISVDGPRAVHDKLRARNSYDSALDSILRIARAGFNTRIVCSLSRLNYMYVREMRELVSDLSRKSGRKISLVFKLLVPPKNLSSELRMEKAHKLELKRIFESENVPCNSFFVGFGKKGEYSFFGCQGRRLSAVIDVDGNVFKCLYQREKSLGNAFDLGFKTLWKENNLDLVKTELKKCKRCKFRTRCGGFCDA